MIMVHIEYATVSSLNESGAWCARIYNRGSMVDLEDSLWGGTPETLFLHAMTRVLEHLDSDDAITFVINNPNIVNTVERSSKWQYTDAKKHMRSDKEARYWLRFWAARRGRLLRSELMTPMVDLDLYHKAFQCAKRCAI